MINLPFNRIHDPSGSYGRLLFPIFWKINDRKEIRWLGFFDDYGFRITDGKMGFHNCTKTKIY